MPSLDLGPVVGPQGEQGATGAQGIRGEQGLPGPNQVTNSTATPLTGVLTGNGSVVGVTSVDATPTAESTNLVSSGGVNAALGTKLNKEAVSLNSSNDLNDIVEPGWYKCTTTPANAPSGNFQNAWFEVVVNGSSILQFAYSNPASSTGGTPKVRLRINGAWEDWVSFDENFPYANQSQLAYVETGTTASRAYAIGEYFCWNGLLYRAKTAIGNGDTFTVNTNCEQVTVGNEIRDTGWILATAKISGTTTYYRKSGKIVSVTVDVNANVMTGSWQEITSLPSGFRPRITIYNNVYDYDGRTMFYAITEGGGVQIKGTSVNPLAFEAVFFAN